MKLHTICILVISSILTVGFEANAQLDPNMEASAGCTVNCFFDGMPQASDNLRGLSKIQPRLQKINEFISNPSTPVNAELAPQFAPVGTLDRRTSLGNGKSKFEQGSAVIVSPCYVLTNHHVAFGEDKTPIGGKNYEMIFRGGVGSDAGGFAGHTSATPVVWGAIDDRGRNDWALLKLNNCVGQLDAFGWVEATRFSQDHLIQKHQTMTAVGFANGSGSQATYSNGTVRGVDAITGMMQFDGSLSHEQSGGALFTMEDGQMKLAGLTTGGLKGQNDSSSTFSSWTADRSNLVQGASEILNRPAVKTLLDADKATFGQPNPATVRLARPLPKSSVQMAGI